MLKFAKLVPKAFITSNFNVLLIIAQERVGRWETIIVLRRRVRLDDVISFGR